MYIYKTRGTCSSEIQVELNGDIIENVKIIGGCNGNLKGISSLLKGMPAREAIQRMRGITCGMKKTSCPDQISIALEEAIKRNED